MKYLLMLLSMMTILSSFCFSQTSESFIKKRLDDPRAVYLDETFGVKGDGKHDDAPGIQRAIDTLYEKRQQGIVFIPRGKYRLGRTIYIWRGIRLIGYGKKRPVFILSENTPGYQQDDRRYVIQFCGGKPKADAEPPDASNTTFGSGIINIDLVIEKGNPGAVAIRYNVAQHCTLRYMDFDLGDAETGLEQIGNEIVNCSFRNGQYAIKTKSTSAGWQALLMDCYFADQKTAAIQSKWAGLTLIRCRFDNVPVAVDVPPGGTEHLYAKDCMFNDISEAAIICDKNENPHNKINIESSLFTSVPKIVKFRRVDESISFDAHYYEVQDLSYGLHITNVPNNQKKQYMTRLNAVDMKNTSTWLRGPLHVEIPDPNLWINIAKLGAKGDGKTDDTEVFKKAIKKFPNIYIPTSEYKLSDTLVLKPTTNLLGLHPMQSIFVTDEKIKGFDDANTPNPLVVNPKGGNNVVTGIGFDPKRNPGLICLKWMASSGSLADDVFFKWSKGKSGSGQYYGLWITDNGGGTFKSIWTPNNHARNGLYVSDTSTKGELYLLSVEHHNQVETVFENVSNWFVCALQTEVIKNGGEKTVAVEMKNCHDIEFANLFLFRAGLDVRFPYAMKLTDCSNLTFRGIHNFVYRAIPYDTILYDTDSGTTIEDPEVAYLTLRPE